MRRTNIYLFWWEFETMLDYSHSLPSGTTPWKMWRRKGPDGWYVGQYVPCSRPECGPEKHVDIRWFKVELREGPIPPGYQVPDWTNYDRWRRDHREARNVGSNQSQSMG